MTTIRPPADAPRQPRIFRVHGSRYHHDEVLEAPGSHTDARLADVAAMGFNGVWIHANLKWLAPTALFEPYVSDVAPRVDALNQTIERAAAHGIGVWLYLNEPRGLPKDHLFWEDHPDCAGNLHDNNAWDLGWPWPLQRQPCRCMCMSAPPVERFVREGVANLLRQAPKLAGIIAITNSEHPNHCYSKIGKGETNCPRCVKRKRIEMPIAVLSAMHQGITDAGSAAQLAAWTWSWAALEPDPQPQLLAALPKEVALVVDFERGHPIEREGIAYTIDEYAFSIVGPSKRFETYREAANDRPIWAKLQIGATHELATMPNIPAIGALYDKVAAMRQRGVGGALATWTMGLRLTANSFVSGRVLAAEGDMPSLAELAAEYFGIDRTAAEAVAAGWRGFSEAIRYFPTTMPMCYFAPINYAPAFHWKLKREGIPMARSWTPEPWGDKIEQSVAGFTMTQVATLMSKVAAMWRAALPAYDAALATVDNERATQERHVAEACCLFYESCAGAYRFADAVDQGADVDALRPLIEQEIAVCERAAELLAADERLGWHDDFGYMITPALIAEKVDALRAMLEGANT